jgi:hypothetical protein
MDMCAIQKFLFKFSFLPVSLKKGKSSETEPNATESLHFSDSGRHSLCELASAYSPSVAAKGVFGGQGLEQMSALRGIWGPGSKYVALATCPQHRLVVSRQCRRAHKWACKGATWAGAPSQRNDNSSFCSRFRFSQIVHETNVFFHNCPLYYKCVRM